MRYYSNRLNGEVNNMSEYKLYKIDGNDHNQGIAKVEILKELNPFMGKRLFRVQIVEIITPSEFVKCRVGAKRDVVETLLMDIS